MHQELLNKNQINLLPLVKVFKSSFGLIGETAINLQTGSRKTKEFSLASLKNINSKAIKQKIKQNNYQIQKILVDNQSELTLIIKEVKFTFLHYPYKITFPVKLKDIITMPDLLTLASMKAYALSRRSKWKDYVDLYFIIKQGFELKAIIKKAKDIFGAEFNEKIFKN